MNKRNHRLVFDRRRGMAVPTAEHTRSAGKPAAGERTAVAACVATLVGAMMGMTPGGEASAQTAARQVNFAGRAVTVPGNALPKRYGEVTQRTDRPFHDARFNNKVSWTVNGNSAVFDQGDVKRIILNWDSFDIGPDGSVHFKQDKDAAALNKVWSSDPTVILGRLSADGEVIIQNANGVLFGRGAQVDTQRLVATALSVSDRTFEAGLRSVTDGSAVFDAAGTDYKATDLRAAVAVEDGARLYAAAGGDVLLIAPRVSNQGEIRTPQGQTVLAAGQRVYMTASTNYAQRGLIVAVDAYATGSDQTLDVVENINRVVAESGTINLVGMTVRQKGVLSATTAVKGLNGAIYLQAQRSSAELSGTTLRDSGLRNWEGSDPGAYKLRTGGVLGTLEIGEGSLTEVTPSLGTQTQLDAETFNPSIIRLEGAHIRLGSNSTVSAAGGKIDIIAVERALSEETNGQSPLIYEKSTAQLPEDNSRLVIEAGAKISVAGTKNVVLPAERNQLTGRLFSIELADSPVQKGHALYRQEVSFDLRDLSATTVANVSGFANNIQRTASEISAKGGQLRLLSQGALMVDDQAELDISGGQVTFLPGEIKTTLLGYKGSTVSFGRANSLVPYDEVITPTRGTKVPGYVEGKDGGTAVLSASRMVLGSGQQLKGGVVEGERQRAGLDPKARAARVTIGAVYNNAQMLDAVQLVSGRAGASMSSLLQGKAWDTVAVADLPSMLALDMAAMQAWQVGDVFLRADVVSQPDSGARLVLPAGGRFDVLAQSITLQGSIVVPGGTINLETSSTATDLPFIRDITLGSQARLSTAGLWTNDVQARLDDTAATAVSLHGGTITVKAFDSLTAEQGSSMDVSAGAWLGADGSLARGSAGTLSLAVGQGMATLDGTLSGFDFSKGGTLRLTVPTTVIADDTGDGLFYLTPGFFSEHGFGNIAITTQGDLTLRADTQLKPVLRNWVLPGLYAGQASRTDGLTGFATAQAIDTRQQDRKPVNLSFTAGKRLQGLPSELNSDLLIERGAGITLEAQGKLALNATGSIGIDVPIGDSTASTTLSTAGGSITLAITGARGMVNGEADVVGFDPTQGILIGSNAKLSVAGTQVQATEVSTPAPAPAHGVKFGRGLSSFSVVSPELVTNTQGLSVARDVLGGGTITLDAARGYIVAQAGSSFNLDGAVGLVDIDGASAAVRVARSAGKLDVMSAEGFVMAGTVSAKAPTAENGTPLADGGTLRVAIGISRNQQGQISSGLSGETSATPYLDAPRVLRIAASADQPDASQAVWGQDFSPWLGNGTAHVSTSLLGDAGFSALSLLAGDTIAFARSAMPSVGAGGDPSKPPAYVLAARTTLDLNASSIRLAEGMSVVLDGPAVSMGTSMSRTQGAAAADTSSTLGTSTLTVHAGTVHVRGTSGLQGVGTTTLNTDKSTAGAVYLSVPGASGIGIPEGALNFAGQLKLQTEDVYTATLTRFTLAGSAGTDEASASSIQVSRTATGARGMGPLSVLGHLTLKADGILQQGTLRQPFGAISLIARDTLTLASGSLTSVEGDQRTLLFGRTQSLASLLDPGGTALAALPQDKRIELVAPRIVKDAGATVSAQGGGDLLAHEFFPGVGGSTNLYQTEGVYAVLPDHLSWTTPDFESIQKGEQGRQIEILMNGSGLPIGRYTVLPASYALLNGHLPQGAYLVRRAADQGGTLLTQPIGQGDGSVVVTAHLTQAGSIDQGTVGERWEVMPPATFKAKTDMRLTSIGTFLGTKAQNTGKAVPLLPKDGGTVAVDVQGMGTVDKPSILDGTFLLGAGSQGLAGNLDITSPAIAVSSTRPTTGADANALWLAPSLLGNSTANGNSNIGSVMLGGWRVLNGQTVTLDAQATLTKTLSVNADLNVAEIILHAQDRLSLGDGLTITASGNQVSAPRQLQWSGAGADVIVSRNSLIDLVRSAPDTSMGTLNIGRDVTLSGGLAQIDSTRALTLGASLALSAPVVRIGAQGMDIGHASGRAGYINLDADVIATLQNARQVLLRSYSSIDFHGSQDWSAHLLDQLTLDTPYLSAQSLAGQAGTGTSLAARSIVLTNTSGAPTGAALDNIRAGSAALTLTARPDIGSGQTGGLRLGPGDVRLNATQTTLSSLGDVIADGSGSVTAQADLHVVTARITGTDAARTTIAADGVLYLEQASGGRSLGELTGGGATLNFKGTRIEQKTWVEALSGTLNFEATATTPPGSDQAAILFDTGSRTLAHGFAVQAQDGWMVASDGGVIGIRAAAGAVKVLGTLDVSAAVTSVTPQGSQREGSAGRVQISAAGTKGTLELGADAALLAHTGHGQDDQGGSFTLDVTTQDLRTDSQNVKWSTLEGLAQRLSAGGFDQALDLRVRTGPVSLTGTAGTTTLAAQRLILTADGGALTLTNAQLDARGGTGGVIQLFARDNLTLAGQTALLAGADLAWANGGDILLSSTSGRLSLGQALLDASTPTNGGDTASDGRIVLRASRGTTARTQNLQIDTLANSQLNAAQVILEGTWAYTGFESIGTGATSGKKLGQDSIKADSDAFLSTPASILGKLGVSGSKYSLRAGVEVISSTNLTIANDWNLDALRSGGQAGMLTLRAAGNLLINNNLSDGFTTATSTVLSDKTSSWSYRLVAGADTASANVMATNDKLTGDLSVAAAKVVRTGAGSIEMAAGRNITLGSGTSTARVYAAGRKGVLSAAESALFTNRTPPYSASIPTFTQEGGRVELQARGDIVSAVSRQLVGNWLNRTGRISDTDSSQYSATNHLAWWTDFANFQQTLGSFGGGDIRVVAGGDIKDLSVASATGGMATSKTAGKDNIKVFNGGDVLVQAGGDISGGQYFVARGTGRVKAQGGLIAGSKPATGLFASAVFAMMDGSWAVSTQGDLQFTTAYNPTLGPTATAWATNASVFSTYGDDSAMTAVSAGGNVALDNTASTATFGSGGYQGLNAQSNLESMLGVLPGTIRLAGLGGDVSIKKSGVHLLMAPSSQGNLEIYAERNVDLNEFGKTLGMIDQMALELWPQLGSPLAYAQLNTTLTNLNTGFLTRAATLRTPLSLVHSNLHADDTAPVRMAAGGSIIGSGNTGLSLPKQALITAGEDIINLRVLGQHHRDSDFTLVEAGRNLLNQDADGSNAGISLAGPGRLNVLAGQELDLADSRGVETTGNLYNASLPATGASIKIGAGMKGTVDLAAFEATYLDTQATPRATLYRERLVNWVAGQLGLDASTLAYPDALAQLAQLPSAKQTAFANEIVASEFGARYLSGDTVTTADGLRQSLLAAFTRHLQTVLASAEQALSRGEDYRLPGDTVLRGAALQTYIADLRKLGADDSYAQLGIDALVTRRAQQLNSYASGWRNFVAATLGQSVQALEALSLTNPDHHDVLAYQRLLSTYSGSTFQRYRDDVLAAELKSAGSAASEFGENVLPWRSAFLDQGFLAAELAGVGNFKSQPYWQGPAPVFSFAGTLNMTGSSVVTHRGGDIFTVSPGGASNIGLQASTDGNQQTVRGLVALGGGNINAYAQGDFQVNVARVFVVGKGDLTVWSSGGDIDSGRGANTAVAAPPPVARRTADGVIFETPAVTTGSGLGILENAAGVRDGEVGLHPAVGMIQAQDAYIRGPSVRVGGKVNGDDNIQSPKKVGAARVVAGPVVPAVAPQQAPTQSGAVPTTAEPSKEQAKANSMLTVELLGLGATGAGPEADPRCQDPQAPDCPR